MTIYLDYMSTTPVDPRVAQVMWDYLTPEGEFGNPASVTHAYGMAAKAAVEQARQQVAALINASPKEIVWTSGATEADNLAIKGVAEWHQQKGRHIITSVVEHKAVLDTCQYLEGRGFEVTYLPVDSRGLIQLDQLANAIRDDTILVSIMQVNNELGTIQDIQAIGELTRQRDILLHVDAAQSLGKIPIDMQQLPVDLMSLASHKIYGPKGVGVLFVRRKPRARLTSLIHGGGHELGLRSGTLPTHQIVGMGKACELMQQHAETEAKELRQLRDDLWRGLQDLDGVSINGSLDHSIPGILNLHIKDTNGESLVTAIQDQLAVSMGSACTSATVEPSYVLRAIGLTAEEASNSIRLSVGRFTTAQDIQQATQILREKILWLRSLSPLW